MNSLPLIPILRTRSTGASVCAATYGLLNKVAASHANVTLVQPRLVLRNASPLANTKARLGQVVEIIHYSKLTYCAKLLLKSSLFSNAIKTTRMKKILLLILLPIVAHSQTITTIAGGGSNVFSGNGVPATTAGLPDTIGGAWDKYGNYYFADALGAHVVRKVDADGIVTTVAGNNLGGFSSDGVLATASKLYSPQAVRLDTFGNLYSADAQNARIRKVDKLTGIISTIAGTGIGAFSGDNGPATLAQIWNPQDICFDKWGNLYIAESSNYRVRKIDPSAIIDQATSPQDK